MAEIDYLVVGSGCSGAMAAQTLIEAGRKVTVLDAGFSNPQYETTVPDKAFLDIRQSESQQYRYFIGDQGQGVVWDSDGKAAQVTPTRQHMTEMVDRLMPVRSTNFHPIESLGYGGLGIGWGLQCWEYSEAELQAAGLDVTAMNQAYEVVNDRIGISGTKDSAAKYTLGRLKAPLPSPNLDKNHRLVYQKFLKRQGRLQAAGFYLGRTPLALLTKNKGRRQSYAYRDMDFYDDNGYSAWRPWMTINQLRKHKNFQYLNGYLVISFKETKVGVKVTCQDIKTGQPKSFVAKNLILAAGAFSSGRIALRSLDPAGRLPFLCNSYTYVPCLQTGLLGKAAEPKKLGFGQLSLFLDESGQNNGASVASMYGYQSLMMFRIIKFIPLGFKEARKLMQYLMSGLVIMAVHHPDTFNPDKYVRLVKAKTFTGDVLEANFTITDDEQAEYRRRERKIIKAGKRLGLRPLKRLELPAGASIHYAGTLPFSDEPQPLKLDRQGRLHGTQRVFVADSSGFTYLPAKGLTFSLMANAHIIARNSLNHD